jgi:hypothetical protein
VGIVQRRQADIVIPSSACGSAISDARNWCLWVKRQSI